MGNKNVKDGFMSAKDETIRDPLSNKFFASESGLLNDERNQTMTPGVASRIPAIKTKNKFHPLHNQHPGDQEVGSDFAENARKVVKMGLDKNRYPATVAPIIEAV